MTLPVQPVTCRFYDESGAPMSVSVSFKLNRQEVYNNPDIVSSTLVVSPDYAPVITSIVTGTGIINLWPNALGQNGSQYSVRATDVATGKKVLDSVCTVPNSPCYLDDILNQEPFPPIDASEAALIAAQAALAAVTAQATIAADNAALTAADVLLTGAAAAAADLSAQAAAASEAAALASETSATRQASWPAYNTIPGTSDYSAKHYSFVAGEAAASTAADVAQIAADVIASEAARDAAQLAETGAQGNQAAAEAAALLATSNGAAQAALAADQVVIATAKAGEASTSASNAAASAAAASGSASSASGSAATATTKAGEASASADNAATSATAASGSASSASGHAATATTQAGNAAASAGTATTQAGTATTKASEALTSANNAAASFDSFDDRYLGSKATAPTLDNDGAALLTGALYWDSTLLALRVWTGSAWTNTTELDDRVLADQQLLAGIAYATDMALHAVQDLVSVPPQIAAINATVATYDILIKQLTYATAQLLDLAGVTARAIAGGDVQLRMGGADNPSLRPDGDPNTGLFFPAADTLAGTTGGVERWRTDSNGYTGFGTNAPSGLLDVNDNRIRIRTAKTPASATAAGNAGDVCWDASFLYVCTSTNVWRRTAITTW